MRETREADHTDVTVWYFRTWILYRLASLRLLPMQKTRPWFYPLWIHVCICWPYLPSKSLYMCILFQRCVHWKTWPGEFCWYQSRYLLCIKATLPVKQASWVTGSVCLTLIWCCTCWSHSMRGMLVNNTFTLFFPASVLFFFLNVLQSLLQSFWYSSLPS